MLSGGADSVCLLHVAAQLLGAGRVQALHVNHGLRAAAGEDERFCADLCARLGVELHVERVEIPARGNIEALAREARYDAAERVRAAAGLDLIATGHTASDQVETILYRLVSSPGRRALLGMEPVRGRLVRPLLAVSRGRDPRVLRGGGPAVDGGRVQRRPAPGPQPAAPRRAAAAAGDQPGADAQRARDRRSAARRGGGARAGGGRGAASAPARAALPPAVDAARLAAEPPPVRRLVLRRLAEEAAGAPVALGPDDAREIERLAERGGSGTVDLGGGLQATVEYGVVRFGRGPSGRPAAGPGCPGDPGQLPFRGVGGRLGARAGGARPATSARPTSRCSTRTASRARSPCGLARRRPHAAARPGRDQVAAGPVHRPEGAALAAALSARGRVRTARSPGWRAWRSRSGSGSRPDTLATVRLTASRRSDGRRRA